jgi:hypothetical protein
LHREGLIQVADPQLDELLTTLKSVDPARGVDKLLAMPPSQANAMLRALTVYDVVRCLNGAHAHNKPGLLAILGPQVARAALDRMPSHQVVDFVLSLPIVVAADLLRGMPSAATATLLLEMPTKPRAALQEILDVDSSPEAAAANYRQAAELSVARIVAGAVSVETAPNDLYAEVIGRSILIAIRFHSEAPFAEDEVRAAASGVNWQRVSGTVVMTNAEMTEGVGAVLRDLRQHGLPTEVVRWVDQRDDGALKRAMIRLFR